ncbi:hypothetical protein [Aurantibacter sp.]|uniref:hypothetical protein n=1 Tax=Aurantibacter sp. TaxID=2807103 RepID=UPI0032665AD4
MTETFELRAKPYLKINLNEKAFEIVDAAEPTNNGSYLYQQVNSVVLNSEKTNWWFSALTVLIDLFTSSGNSGKYKDKANLYIALENRQLKIWLYKADFEKAKKVAYKLQNTKKS